MGRVEGKVAFITGAARGQGRSHAVRLAEEGAHIIALDICAPLDGPAYRMPGPEDLAETVRQVKALDRRVIGIEGDVRNADELRGSLDAAVAELGTLDIVCANAGIATYRPAQELSQELWQETIDINLTGVWNTCQASLPHIADGGSIILTGSTLSVKGVAHAAHYAAAKHGVLGVMRVLAHELAPRMIRVNSVLPTMVDTELLLNEATFRLFRPDLEAPTVDDIAPIFTSLNILPIPWVESVDVSNAVLYLASDEARYVTSVALPVDAGTAAK